MNQPAREENGRRRNSDESTSRDVHILWKTFKLSSEQLRCMEHIDRKPEQYGLFFATGG
jgi:hypothetical protein